MHDKVRIAAFAEFIRQNGEEKMMDYLEQNKKVGVVYHYPGQLVGDYDKCETVDEVIKATNGFIHISTRKFEYQPFTAGFMEWCIC